MQSVPEFGVFLNQRRYHDIFITLLVGRVAALNVVDGAAMDFDMVCQGNVLYAVYEFPDVI